MSLWGRSAFLSCSCVCDEKIIKDIKFPTKKISQDILKPRYTLSHFLISLILTLKNPESIERIRSITEYRMQKDS